MSATLHTFMPFSLAVSLLGNILSSTKDTKGKKFLQAVCETTSVTIAYNEIGHRPAKIELKFQILKSTMIP
jgi:hypothetical protein